ncbi:MAG: hypothetical protein H6754_04050 [Candidatus Omnitrophica bacterium]|nr:hypothetical protein [Candidatus Omnitrophota bacterium]
MRFVKTFFICLFMILGVTLCVQAQEDLDISSTDARSLSNPQWQKTIDQITAETQSLMKENEKLSSEYEFLQEKVAGLKAELTKTKAQVKVLQSSKQKISKVMKDSGKNDPDAKAKMDDLQNEIDAIESENKDLEKQLLDIQEKNRLWKIQASKLENQKRDAVMDTGYAQATSEAETKDLQNQLQSALAKEKELVAALARVTAENEARPKQAVDLRKKNRDLEDRLKILKRQIVAQEKKNEKLQRSAKKVKGNSKGVSGDLVRQKKALEAEIASLTSQLDSVSKTVGQSREVLEKKRMLMDQIMRLDAENQELRSKIDAMHSTQSE